jgi:hypothetical protein
MNIKPSGPPTGPPTGPPSFTTDEQLEKLLLEGLDSGQPVPVDAQFWRDLALELEQRKDLHRKAS